MKLDPEDNSKMYYQSLALTRDVIIRMCRMAANSRPVL